MFRNILIVLAIILVIGLIASFLVARDGQRVTPDGSGEIQIGDKTFEAFPLPAYAAAFVTEDYKS